MEDGQLELPPVEDAGQQTESRGGGGAEGLEEAVEQELHQIVAGAASLAAHALAPDGDAAQLPPPTVVAPPADAPAALTDGGVVLAVGTANRAKLDSVASAAERMFSAHSIRAFPADSGVSAQPMSVAETMDGARNRAQGALAAAEEAGVSAEFGVGIEGGLEQIGPRWFEAGWVCVVRKADGATGFGSCGRYEVAGAIVRRLQGGEELCEVMDDLSGTADVRSGLGMMGVVTNGLLPRAECYTHGLLFAFARFLSDARYWAP